VLVGVVPSTWQEVAPPGQWQAPSEQDPPLHELAQVPQWNGSVCKSEQVPPHCTVGASHAWTHRPW
jgi:hypothetical protein